MHIDTGGEWEQQSDLRRETAAYARSVADKASGKLTLRDTGNGKTHRWDRQKEAWVLPKQELKRLMEQQALFQQE